MRFGNFLLLISIVVLLSGCDADSSFVPWQGKAERAYIKGLRAQKGELPGTDPMVCFNSAIAFDPKQSSYYRSRSGLFLNKGNYDMALADLDRAISISPNWHYLYFERGYCKCVLGEFDSALKDFERAIQGQPDNSQFYSGVALVNLALENQVEALNAIDKAISLSPQFEKLHYQKAVILSRENLRNLAVKEFERTVVCIVMLKNNEKRMIYFDGPREFDKVRSSSFLQIAKNWNKVPDTKYYLEK